MAQLTQRTMVTLAFGGFAAAVAVACAQENGGAPESGGPEAAVAFPAEPPDGPMPEIGPAPEGYTPTAAGSPSTDIWMGTLVRDGGALSVSGLAQATDRDAYDNQPSFLLDGSAILHTAALDRRQTEIMRLAASGAGDGAGSGASERLTRTEEASEFSALQIPGQDAFSAIHEIRGKQYLWRYDLSGEPLGPIFATAEPVGYHAWANEHVVAMFILGDPPTLQVGDALSGEIRVVAERPGRSIHRVPGTAAISFVRKISDEEWWIERLGAADGASERITLTLPGREDYAWTPEGEILMGDGGRLFAWSEGSDWTEIADFSDLGVEGITRLAVSPDGSRIAIVANRPGD
ncbi:hypothetical protein [Candidatus Palauibacter polyketidifaciens]|uniref:hypothetical protein n=1 Tax=Candidatus Palauibacter polyketidifaciens TaxID=3056740 RepID=UPI0023846E59|nr:hypothetical protein [Candidatus Palauibacter polyketidifaciens]MDE2719737.1 hypothetical protein [Candidatus Palauibacter polyketidifaciens]